MKAKLLVGFKNCGQVVFFETLEILVVIIAIQNSINWSVSALSFYENMLGKCLLFTLCLEHPRKLS